MGMKTGQKKKEGKKGEGTLQSEATLGEVWEVGQNWRSVSAAAEGPQRRTEAVMRMQQEVQVKRIQMGGGDFTKVEAATRGRPN